VPSQLSTREATAPCRLELIDGPLPGAADAGPEGVLRLAVALDRRVFCRVEPRDGGVEIHSKDTGERIVADDARDITDGRAARVARMLLAAGVGSGVRVVIQVRVPEDAGLGTTGALQVAVSAALGRSSAEILDLAQRDGAEPGRVVRRSLRETPRILGTAAWSLDAEESESTESDRHAALYGGAHALWVRRGALSIEPVAADPARLEECLLLVDPGPEASFSPPPPARSAAAVRVFEGLEAGAYDDVTAILAEVHRARFDAASPALQALALAIDRAGGVAWPCGRLVAVWAVPGARSPGPREAVSSALKEAGVRSFPARVDLRGLEVE
jgi:hypothetical protein